MPDGLDGAIWFIWVPNCFSCLENVAAQCCHEAPEMFCWFLKLLTTFRQHEEEQMMTECSFGLRPVRVYLLTSSLFLIRRNKQLTFSSPHEGQSRADRDCGDSDDSCEQPSTSDPFYSPRELVSSPLMSTPAGHGGLPDSVICHLAAMWFLSVWLSMFLVWDCTS